MELDGRFSPEEGAVLAMPAEHGRQRYAHTAFRFPSQQLSFSRLWRLLDELGDFGFGMALEDFALDAALGNLVENWKPQSSRKTVAESHSHQVIGPYGASICLEVAQWFTKTYAEMFSAIHPITALAHHV